MRFYSLDTERFSDGQKAILQRLVAGKLYSTRVVEEQACERVRAVLDMYRKQNDRVDTMLLDCRKRMLEFLRLKDGPVQVWGDNLVSTTTALQNMQRPAIDNVQMVGEHMMEFGERVKFLTQCDLDEIEQIRKTLHLEEDFPPKLDKMVALRWNELQHQKLVVETRTKRHEIEARDNKLRLKLLAWRGALQFGSQKEGAMVYQAQHVSARVQRLELDALRLRCSLRRYRLLLQAYQLQYDRLRHSPLLHYLTEREQRGKAAKAKHE